jgi:hypothetical protein
MRLSTFTSFFVFILSGALLASPCEAQSLTAARATKCNTVALPRNTNDARVDFLVALALRESSGDKRCVNYAGYLGLFQMGGGALADANFYVLGPSGKENAWDGTFSSRARVADVISADTFLEHAGAQELAVREYHDLQWATIVRLGLDSRVGDTVAGVTLSKSGMLGGCHLLGVGGLTNFIRSRGSVVPRDGNGTPITEYLRLFQPYY